MLSLQGDSTAAGPPSDDVYGHTDFYGVPRLGHETVSGTGCGGDGSVGATIPDGLWRGYARSFDGPTPGESARVEFDLVCVYRGNVNPELVARWRADHPGQIEPWVLDGFMINNNAAHAHCRAGRLVLGPRHAMDRHWLPVRPAGGAVQQRQRRVDQHRWGTGAVDGVVV